MLRTGVWHRPGRYALPASRKTITRRCVASLNTVIFLILSLSMLMGAEETGRWKVVAVAVASVLVQASLRELLPGVMGALIAVVGTVAFIERPFVRKIVGAYAGCSVVLSIFSAMLSDIST
jgi:hypothetical protein